VAVPKEKLLDLYEAKGELAVYEGAVRLYEEALGADAEDSRSHCGYGYLLECRARRLLRQAVSHYERATELEPNWPKPRLQALYARAALLEPDHAVEQYRRHLRTAPGDLAGHRYLACALLVSRAWDEAMRVADAGLTLGPQDPMLIELKGDALAGAGSPGEALQHWERAYRLDPENLSPCFSRAFLLEREGRLQEAVDTWQAIVEWHEARDDALGAEWPRRELERLASRPQSR
jgi:tetratricopeptide (TPR) repeat protein